MMSELTRREISSNLIEITRLITMLREAGIKPVQDEDGPQAGIEHVYWMLTVLYRSIGADPKFDAGKVGRWLGFCQYAVIDNGYTTVKASRDFTRPLFSNT